MAARGHTAKALTGCWVRTGSRIPPRRTGGASAFRLEPDTHAGVSSDDTPAMSILYPISADLTTPLSIPMRSISGSADVRCTVVLATREHDLANRWRDRSNRARIGRDDDATRPNGRPTRRCRIARRGRPRRRSERRWPRCRRAVALDRRHRPVSNRRVHHPADVAWCTAADVQIMRNIARHQADHARSSQQRYFDVMRAHDRYRIPLKDGVDPGGWTAGLRRYVDDRYRLVASASFDSALRSAVTNLRRRACRSRSPSPMAITPGS